MLEEDLSVAAIHRIIRKSDADRVSESGTRELARVLEELGVQIGKYALAFSMHAGRKTVRKKDVKIAAEKVLSR